MRLSRRDYQHVALLKIVAFAVRDVLGGHLAGSGWLGFNGGTADNDRRASVNHIEDVGFFFVDLDVTVRGTAISLYIVSITGNQRVSALFFKIVEHPLALDIGGGRYAILSRPRRAAHRDEHCQHDHA